MWLDKRQGIKFLIAGRRDNWRIATSCFSRLEKVALMKEVYFTFLSRNFPTRDDPYWTSKKNSLELGRAIQYK